MTHTRIHRLFVSGLIILFTSVGSQAYEPQSHHYSTVSTVEIYNGKLYMFSDDHEVDSWRQEVMTSLSSLDFEAHSDSVANSYAELVQQRLRWQLKLEAQISESQTSLELVSQWRQLSEQINIYGSSATDINERSNDLLYQLNGLIERLRQQDSSLVNNFRQYATVNAKLKVLQLQVGRNFD